MSFAKLYRHTSFVFFDAFWYKNMRQDCKLPLWKFLLHTYEKTSFQRLFNLFFTEKAIFF